MGGTGRRADYDHLFYRSQSLGALEKERELASCVIVGMIHHQIEEKKKEGGGGGGGRLLSATATAEAVPSLPSLIDRSNRETDASNGRRPNMN